MFFFVPVVTAEDDNGLFSWKVKGDIVECQIMWKLVSSYEMMCEVGKIFSNFTLSLLELRLSLLFGIWTGIDIRDPGYFMPKWKNLMRVWSSCAIIRGFEVPEEVTCGTRTNHRSRCVVRTQKAIVPMHWAFLILPTSPRENHENLFHRPNFFCQHGNYELVRLGCRRLFGTLFSIRLG